MRRRLLLSSSLLGLMLLALASTASAQSLRADRTFFIKARVGATNYIGDWDRSPFSSTWEGSRVGAADRFPWALGGALELGYQISTRFSVSGTYQPGYYPTISHRLLNGSDFKERHTAQLLLRWTAMADRVVAPFIETGLHGTVGFTHQRPPQNQEDEVAIGPVLGVGLDIAMSDQLSFIVELMTNLTVPDEAVDGNTTDEDELGRFDLLNFAGIGLKYNLKRAVTPVDVLSINCPTQLQVGETGTFTATINQGATQPIEYRWNFGDNATGTGLTASHSYNNPGTYTVSFTATNRGGASDESCTVRVVPRPLAAEIVTLTGNPNRFEVCAPVTVQFNANTRGDEPLNYRWNFGDGTTGTGPNPTHTYTQPGTYTVTLTLSNAAGQVDRTVTIVAEECAASICDDITELNSVYFAQNSSTLTAEARAALQENLEILRECPNICVRVEGFAAPGERNAQQLSADRARAVEQFYIDNGIAASRILSVGRGRVGGTTSKKEGASQFRRADSIPVPCEDLR